MTQDSAAMERATRTVFGVVTARQLGNVDDAAFVLNAYLHEETMTGRSIPSSWAILFSAAATWIDMLLQAEAHTMNTTPVKRINHWSAVHARSLQ